MAMLEIVTGVLLQSVTHHGWHDAVGQLISESFQIKCPSEKLLLLNKALCAYKPEVSGMEILLSEQQLSFIVKQLRKFCSPGKGRESEYTQYSMGEILLLTKAVTKIPANCNGLVEEGVEEVLGYLMEKSDGKMDSIVVSITWQIATGVSASADMNEATKDEENLSTATTVGKFVESIKVLNQHFLYSFCV